MIKNGCSLIQEETVLPRGRGKPRERYRRRFPGGRDDRNMKEDEEARFIAVSFLTFHS